MSKAHPRGLGVLFFTEMWERFSYYGMRGILLLYMTNSLERGGMGLDVPTGSAIYGLYVGLIYLMALPGGWIADRMIGQKNAIFYGGIVIAAGHFTMAIPSDTMFFIGLGLIIVGTGLLKPNVSAIVGDLYPEGGARRDSGFSIFYMGINVGALLGPLVCGYLGENVDWHMGFSAAGVGMVLGLIQYKMGAKHLSGLGEIVATTSAERSATLSQFSKGLAGFLAIAAAIFALRYSELVVFDLTGFVGFMGWIMMILVVLFFAYVLIFGGLETVEKKRVVVIFFLFIGAALFWSGFEQAGSSMNLFAERLTDRDIMGWLMPASFLQSVNSLFIILLAPVFGALWVWLDHREPSVPTKFGFGLLFLGVGFFVMSWGASFTDEGLVSPNWLIATYFLHTVGELCLSPVGLSSVTKLSPKHLVGQMMGIWFTGTALGNLFAGLVAGNFEAMPIDELFMNVCLTSVVAGAFFLLLSKPIQKLIGNIR